jgi:hypothetical protein
MIFGRHEGNRRHKQLYECIVRSSFTQSFFGIETIPVGKSVIFSGEMREICGR